MPEIADGNMSQPVVKIPKSSCNGIKKKMPLRQNSDKLERNK